MVRKGGQEGGSGHWEQVVHLLSRAVEELCWMVTAARPSMKWGPVKTKQQQQIQNRSPKPWVWSQSSSETSGLKLQHQQLANGLMVLMHFPAYEVMSLAGVQTFSVAHTPTAPLSPVSDMPYMLKLTLVYLLRRAWWHLGSRSRNIALCLRPAKVIQQDHLFKKKIHIETNGQKNCLPQIGRILEKDWLVQGGRKHLETLI